MITPDMEQKVSEIVRTDLDQGLRRHLAFGPIVVDREIDEFADDAPAYVHIKIVFEGDQKHLDPRWIAGMIPRIRPKLLEIGVDEYPLPSFIAKNEWNEWLRLNRRARRGTD